MKLLLLLLICFSPGVICSESQGCYLISVLCGITIFLMTIAIIGLSTALYMVKNNKSMFGITINKPHIYVRQESGIGVTLRNVTSTNDINDQCRHDGSTLTVNSGIVEIGAISEPHTPIREENKISYIKKPAGPVIPTIQKAQMDKIIEDVLSRRQKSDSATFREIDALAKLKTSKLVENDFKYGKNSASIHEVDGIPNEDIEESLYGNALAINLLKHKTEIKDKVTESRANQTNSKVSKDNARINANLAVESEEDEHEVYDTLPNPVRCANSENSDDSYVETLDINDLPTKSWGPNENRNVVMDQDTQYLLPLSKRVIDEENTSYVNAKHQH